MSACVGGEDALPVDVREVGDTPASAPTIDDAPAAPGSAADAYASPPGTEPPMASLSLTEPHVRVEGGTGSCQPNVFSTCVDSIPMTGRVSPLFDTADHSMRQFMQINCVGGGVLAVSRNGRRVYKRGFGRTKGAAGAYSYCDHDDWDGFASYVRPDTPFPLASVTKFLTATAVRELLIENGSSDPSAEKAVDHMPGDLEDYFVHTAQTGTCAPIAGWVLNGQGGTNPATEDTDPRSCGAFQHPDDRWPQVTIGDLIGHSSGFSYSPWYNEDLNNPNRPVLLEEFAELRSNTGSTDWIWEDAVLGWWTKYPNELDDARQEIYDELILQGQTLPGGGPISLGDIKFIHYYNALDFWTPVDDYLIRAAGNVLEDPGPQAAKDSDIPLKGSTTGYSNNGYRMLGRIAANLHVQLHGGQDLWAPPDGAPELHEDTALGWFLADNQIDEGIWSDHAIFARQFGYAPGYEDPTPYARKWDANVGAYEWLERSETRPWCLLDGGVCDFTHWRSANAALDGYAPSWDFQTGLFSSLRPYYRNEPTAWLSGAGDLAAEMPALLTLLDRYYAGGGDSRATLMGMPRDDCDGMVTCAGSWSGKTGNLQGVGARVVQLRGDSDTFDSGSVGTPKVSINDNKLTFDTLWTGPILNVNNPDDVDFAVAINQSAHEGYWNNGDWFKKLHRFVMYGLRDDGGTAGDGVDWLAVDRMIHHQGRHVVGMSMDGNSNTVYWYESDGATQNVQEIAHGFLGTPASHQGGASAWSCTYALPATRIGTDVLGVAIKDEEVSDVTYAWYDDGHYSTGVECDPGNAGVPEVYTLPNAYGTPDPLKYDQLIDVAFSTAGAAFSWYTDGTRASGTPGDLDYYWTDDFVVPSAQKIGEVESIAIDWANDNRVWARYRDGSVSRGYSYSLGALAYYPAQPIGMSVAGSISTLYYATGWYRKFDGMPGAVQVDSGYWHSGDGSDPAAYRDVDDAVGFAEPRIESNPALPDGRIYYIGQQGAGFKMMVPGSEGAIVYPNGLSATDVIDVAAYHDDIDDSDYYYTYFATGVRAKGTATNLDAYGDVVTYSLPPGKGYADLVAVAMTDGGDVWAMYDDGSMSWGTNVDLDAYGVF